MDTKNRYMIVYDTETTDLTGAYGLDLDLQPQIIDYCGLKVDMDTFEVVEELEQLIRPKDPISSEITEITGITNEDLKDKPSFAEFQSKLSDFHLGVSCLVGHNLMFDLRLVQYELQRMKKEFSFPWPPKQVCTVEETEHLKGRRLKLIDLHIELTGNSFEGAHRARSDSEATLRCVKALASLNQWPH